MRRHQLAHAGAAEIEDLLGDIGIVRRTEQHRDVQAEGRARDRQQLEIAGVAGKDDERTRVVAQVQEDRNARDFHPARLGLVRVEIEQPVEEDIFRREPPHVAPAGERDRLDLRLALFREGVAQIGQHQLVATRCGARCSARQAVGEIDRRIRRKQLQEIQERESDLRHQPLAKVDQRQHEPGNDELHAAQPTLRMILPKTWRLSMRSSAASISSKPTSVSMTG